MAFLTSRKQEAMKFVFTALGTLQRSRDLEMAKDATELEIELRQQYGLPLVRHISEAIEEGYNSPKQGKRP